MKAGDFATLSVDVTERLRDDILAGVLLPGERLRVADLRARFGVSVSVLREGLARLVEQDLVRVEHNRGFYVRPLKKRELVELTAARELNEGEALRLAMETGDVAWEAEVLAAHHRLANTSMTPTEGWRFPREWAAAHQAFHATLLGGCRNEVLIGICSRLQAAAELYRGWAVSSKTTIRHVDAEHADIVEAVLARDQVRAVDLYRRHLRETAAQLLQAQVEET